MKKQTGFTLVELLAVIVILAIVLIIAVPGVLGIIKQSRQKAYDMQLEMIKEAGRLYMTEFDKNVTWTDMNSSKITYASEIDLKKNGYLDKKIVDPRNKKELTDFAVKVTRDANQKTSYEVIFDYSDVGATEASCFTFDKAAHKITGYRSDCPRNVHIPSKIDGVEVYVIKDRLFSYQNLSSIILPKTLKTIEEYAFTGNQLTEINIPKSVTTIGRVAFNKNKVPDEKAFIYKRNSDGSEDKTYLVSYAGYTSNNPVIPNTVKILGNNCFQYAGLISIEIPVGVTMIQHAAFNANQLTNVKIPNTVTAIGTIVFSANRLPEDQAFIYGRKKDGTENKSILVGYGGAKVENVVVPTTVITLANSAFAYSDIKSVIIPSNVVSLGENIFTHSPIEKVTVQGKSSLADFTLLGGEPWGIDSSIIVYEP